ncbi:MAG: ACP phosphodiesterase [Capnocytophaga granulosa]
MRGILLHRQIDTFTDAHPLFRESKRRLVPLYGHYAGVITDIFYDYFLTKHWRMFSSEDLDRYIERFYALLQEKKEVLNPQMQSIAGYMIRDNWLKAYQTYTGLVRILYQMDRRTEFRSQMQYAITSLQTEEPLFEAEFLPFFKEIQ